MSEFLEELVCTVVIAACCALATELVERAVDKALTPPRERRRRVRKAKAAR